MADAKQIQFGQRLSRIDKHHRKLAQGYVTSVNHDGLIIARPQRKSNGLSMRALFVCLMTLLVFKGFLYAQLGDVAYNDRMTLLQNGTLVEKVGAFAMKVDPATYWISEQIEKLM